MTLPVIFIIIIVCYLIFGIIRIFVKTNNKKVTNSDEWDKMESLIKYNNHKQLKKEIKRKPNQIFSVNEEGFTLLMMSASYGAYECTSLLIQNGVDINKKTIYGNTALRCAACSPNFKVAQLLLQQGSDVSSRTNDTDRSAFDVSMKYHRDDNTIWFELFALYKDKFDEKDLALYHEYRLSTLF